MARKYTKYTKETKDKLIDMRLKGMTYQAIADELGMEKNTVHYIINYKAHLTNGISECPFCNSKKTVLACTRGRNVGRETSMYYVRCNYCHARGPRFSYFHNRDSQGIDYVKSLAVKAWDILGVNKFI